MCSPIFSGTRLSKSLSSKFDTKHSTGWAKTLVLSGADSLPGCSTLLATEGVSDSSRTPSTATFGLDGLRTYSRRVSNNSDGKFSSRLSSVSVSSTPDAGVFKLT
ncbi:hypothetical protein D9M72_628150 [compost metagenome]